MITIQFDDFDLFHFLHCNVPDNKCYNQKWGMLLFTCIKLVARVLACALAVARGSLLKYDQLKVFSLGITLVDVVQN